MTEDWMDGCWRCGSDVFTVDDSGRRLCESCRVAVFGVTSGTSIRVSRRVYWESHALVECWRCMDEPVKSEDELGLCGDCKTELVDA